MRRHAIRLVFAALAMSALTACADLATGPEAPTGPRLNGTTSTDTTSRTSTQGSSI